MVGVKTQGSCSDFVKCLQCLEELTKTVSFCLVQHYSILCYLVPYQNYVQNIENGCILHLKPRAMTYKWKYWRDDASKGFCSIPPPHK